MVCVVGCLAALLILVFGFIKYEQWFAYNCLRSHQKVQETWTYVCYYRSRKTGICLDGAPQPDYTTVTICDQWRDQK